ncbi:hypothetical protein GOBAR_DD29768 [Gossypium barbadense]|nr:hypothetical protein GOBAR_DD29768 [Gossypium barbadense]
MGEHKEKHEESLMEKLAEKIHGHDSSSDSDNDKPSESSIKAKVFRLFGRERSVHHFHIPKDPVIEFAEALRFETNLAFTVLRDIASGRDLKKFLYVCCYSLGQLCCS